MDYPASFRFLKFQPEDAVIIRHANFVVANRLVAAIENLASVGRLSDRLRARCMKKQQYCLNGRMVTARGGLLGRDERTTIKVHAPIKAQLCQQ